MNGCLRCGFLNFFTTSEFDASVLFESNNRGVLEESNYMEFDFWDLWKCEMTMTEFENEFRGEIQGKSLLIVNWLIDCVIASIDCVSSNWTSLKIS